MIKKIKGRLYKPSDNSYSFTFGNGTTTLLAGYFEVPAKITTIVSKKPYEVARHVNCKFINVSHNDNLHRVLYAEQNILPIKKDRTINIHYDFTDGSEISYKEGIDTLENFNTCCLDFFCFGTDAKNVIIIDKNNNKLDRNKLLNNKGGYTTKDIKTVHNIQKMFKSGSFKWQNNKK